MSISSQDYFKRQENTEHHNEEDFQSVANALERPAKETVSEIKANAIRGLGFITRKKLETASCGFLSSLYDTTKFDLFKRNVRLSSLLATGVSITDIAAIWDIKDQADLKNLSFHPDDLLDTTLFPSSFAKSIYRINYAWLEKEYRIKPSFFIRKEFKGGDLHHYEFPMADYLSGNLGEKVTKRLFYESGVTYDEWVNYFGLKRADFVRLGVTNIDAVVLRWGEDSCKNVILAKKIDVYDEEGRVTKKSYWDVDEYPDFDYDGTSQKAAAARMNNNNVLPIDAMKKGAKLTMGMLLSDNIGDRKK